MVNCEGCKTNGHCSVQLYGSVAMYECPCRTCIIKVICNTPCELLKSHHKKTFEICNKEINSDGDKYE